MLRLEFKRIINNKVFKLSLILLILASFTQIYLMLMDKTVSHNSEAYQILNVEYHGDLEQFDNNYTDQAFVESKYNVINYMKKIMNLKQNLSKSINDNAMKADLSIYDAEDREILLAQTKRYEAILQSDIRAEDTFFAGNVLKNTTFNILSLGFCLILFYLIFYEDISSGIIHLLSSTFHSSKKEFINKFITACLLSSTVLMLTYGLAIVFIRSSGVGLDTVIQSVNGFSDFPIHMNIIQYMMLSFLFSLCSIIIICQTFLYLLIRFKNMILSICLLTAILAIEFFCYYFISVDRTFSILKDINIVTFIFSLTPAFSENIILSYVTNSYLIIFISLFTIILFLLFMNYRLYTNFNRRLDLKFSLSYGIRSTSLLLQKLYHVLITKKLIIVFIFITFYIGFKYNDFTIIPKPDDLMLEKEREKYYGSIDNDNIKELRTQTKELEQYDIEYQELLTTHNKNGQDTDKIIELQTYLKTYNINTMILYEIDTVKAQGADAYIKQSGYDLLFSNNSNYSIILNLFLCLILILSFITLCVRNDFQHGMILLYKSTENGKKKSPNLSIIISLIASFILISIVYGGFIAKINKIYPIIIGDFSIYNIFDSQIDMSFNVAIIILILTHSIFYIFMCLLIYYISTKYDVFITIPFMITIIIIFIVIYLMNPAYSPILLLTKRLFSHIMASILISLLLMFGSGCLYKHIRKQYL